MATGMEATPKSLWPFCFTQNLTKSDKMEKSLEADLPLMFIFPVIYSNETT